MPTLAPAYPELPAPKGRRSVAPVGFERLDGGLHVAVRRITPEVARFVLDNLNTNNRKMKKSSVNEYARDMERNSWALNGEAIIFDRQSNLLNGQNRLQACVNADQSFDTLVVWGARLETMNSLDRGVKRTVGDVLQLNGHQYAALMGAAINVIGSYDRGLLGRSGGSRQTVSEALDLMTAHEAGLREAHARVNEILGHMLNTSPYPGMSPAIIISLYYLTSQFDPAIAEEFWRGVLTGTELRQGDPRAALRNVLLNDRKRGISRQFRVAALIIKAWNYYLEGRSLGLLRYGVNEGFPSIEGYKPYGWTKAEPLVTAAGNGNSTAPAAA